MAANEWLFHRYSTDPLLVFVIIVVLRQLILNISPYTQALEIFARETANQVEVAFISGHNKLLTRASLPRATTDQEQKTTEKPVG